MNGLDELYQTLELAANRKDFSKSKFWMPYPKQMEFIKLGATFDERLLMAGNRLGKSDCGGFEVAAHLTGDYPSWWPGRRWDRPINAWIAGPSAVSVRDIGQEKLCGPPGIPELFGSGFISKELFVGQPTSSRSAPNAYESWRVRHKSGGVSVVTVKTYEQERTNWQGVGIDLFWPDEEPPMELYTEGRTRLADRHGMSLMTFTPLLGMSDVVIRFMDEAAPNRVMVRMGLVDALHYTDKQRAALLADYPINERQARANGDPLLGSGKVYSTPIEDMKIPRVSLDKVPLEWLKIWGIDFGIDHPFAAVLIAWDREEDVIYILRVVKMTDAVPLQHAAAMKEFGGHVPVAWPHDGHNRDKGSGISLNKLYADEGLHTLDDHATMTAGGYGLYASVTAFDAMMKKRKVKVDESCVDFITEYGQYHYKDGKIVSVRDDVLDAARIAWMMRRKGKPVPLGATVSKAFKRRQTKAPIINPWTGRPVYS